MKYSIRKDIENYKIEHARDIMEESWYIKRVQKALINCSKLLQKLTKPDNTATYNRNKILEKAKEYWTDVYKNSKPTSLNMQIEKKKDFLSIQRYYFSKQRKPKNSLDPHQIST